MDYETINNQIEKKSKSEILPKFKQLIEKSNCNINELDKEDKLIAKMLKFERKERKSAEYFLKNEIYFYSQEEFFRNSNF